MTIWENRTLREARQAARAADEALSRHRRDCLDCSRAQRKRAPQDMCGPGWKLYAGRRDANAELAAQQELAKQPVPGQDSLW